MKKQILAILICMDCAAAAAACSPSGTSCSACTEYSCNSGYYGTATSGSAGCTVCPSNATCAGGNGSTFSCNTGFYKSGSSCASCATNTSHTSATSAAGSTVITNCYLPNGTTGSDTTGSWTITGGNCAYTQ